MKTIVSPAVFVSIWALSAFGGNLGTYEALIIDHGSLQGTERWEEVEPAPGGTLDLKIYNGQFGAHVTAEMDPGAVTVANLNDTDGDGTVDKDDENGVHSNARGRDELDVMKLIVEKPDPDREGHVTLTKVGGSAVLWSESTKDNHFALDNNSRDIDTSELPKTLWIESTATSGGLQDIIFTVTYKEDYDPDTVKATGLWVDLKTTYRVRATSGPDNSIPTNLNDTYLENDITDNAVAADGSYYGIAKFEKRPSTPAGVDTLTGGRILFEWEVKPAKAEDLVTGGG